METFKLLENYSLWGNTAYNYFLALVIFIGFVIILKIFQVIILAKLNRLAKSTKNDLDDALIAIFSKIKPPFYFFVAIYFAIKYLTFPEIVDKVLMVVILVTVVYEVVQAISRFLDFFINKSINNSDNNKSTQKYSQSMLRAVSMIVKAVLWVVAIIMILSNLGINVTSLVASLGIGGIAIALALQNILTDMFSSFSIYVDKPFQIGDYISIGTDSGTVEKIGMKTTRIRTLQGEELVVSNRELTTARVQNFKKMEKRRASVTLGVEYETPANKLKNIPELVRTIIGGVEGTDFDRCHFAAYGDSSLNFELVYYVNSSEYSEFADKRQAINYAIFDAFAKEKISFAYPTQKIVLDK